MILKYRSSDCPDANGRIPKSGEQKWTLSFPLENGDDYLEIVIGRRGREAIKAMFNQEESDDKRDSQPLSNFSKKPKLSD